MRPSFSSMPRTVATTEWARRRASKAKECRLMELQHVNVKLLVKTPQEVDLEPLIPVFHGWIQDQVCEELLLDIADYRHVYAGPGVVLIGHECNYSVDNTDNRLGVRYNRKAARAALTACQRLDAESFCIRSQVLG